MMIQTNLDDFICLCNLRPFSDCRLHYSTAGFGVGFHLYAPPHGEPNAVAEHIRHMVRSGYETYVVRVVRA